jgi:peptidoglycan/xylan/chitin deacetylase (PgdA/CDA1 family)
MITQDLGIATAYGYAKSKGYTGTEEEFAELMADYAEVGQRAEDAADSALESKTAAQTAATTATNKASEATTAATTATTKAGEASTSASTAASAKDTAVSASQTATTKATEATTAAATATSAATTATTAKDDAVSAKTAAQTAQTGAETAAASVEASAAQIATNTEDIESLKSDLTSTLDQNPTKNLFDKNTLTDNLLIDEEGVESQSVAYITSDYIKLPVKAAMISSVGTASTTYKYRIAVYDKNKVWKYRQLGSTDDYVLYADTRYIPTSDEYYYIRISFEKSRGTDFNTVQVEVGTVKTSYVPHLMPLDYYGRIRTEEVNTELSGDVGIINGKMGTMSEEYGVNLFDPTQLIKNTLIDEEGVATPSNIYDSSDFIPIPASAKVIRAFSYTGTPTYRIAFYDSSKNFLFRNTAAYALWEDGYAFNITSACAYARISAENENNPTATVDPFYLVFANGNTMPEFIPYLSAIDLTARNNIFKNGSVEHLKDYEKTSGAASGLTFAWNGNTCTVKGRSATSIAFNTIVDTRAELPAWMQAGQTLYANVKTTNVNIRFNLAWYLSGGGNKYDYIAKDSFVTVPSDAIGVIIRLSIPNGTAVGSATITANLYSAGTNPYLSKVTDRVINEFERRVGTVDDATTPMLTIIDDDGNSKFYTDLYPIAVEKNVPIAAAIPYTFMGIANHVTQAQVLEMYANGIEIVSHTYSHMTTTTATEREYERDYQKAKNNYSLLGIKTDLLVYAGGSANSANAQEAAKRVYIGAFNSGNENTNFSDKNDKYNLERYGITDSTVADRIDGTDLNELKALIDSVKQTGGWMVWMTHTSGAYWSDTMKQNIADAIDYAITQGVAIVTASHGFRKYFGV